MDKKILKKFLIIMGLILLVLNFIICLNDTKNIVEALFSMSFETFVEFGEFKSMLSISGTVLLVFGLLLKKDNISNEVDNNKNSVKKYKMLKKIGYLPFVGILCYSSYSAIFGFSFFFSSSRGIDAFLGSLFFYSLFLWPLYIIGIVLIIKNSSKIKALKEPRSQKDIKKKNLKLLIAVVILCIIILTIFVERYLMLKIIKQSLIN